jgi:hypothetical protein
MRSSDCTPAEEEKSLLPFDETDALDWILSPMTSSQFFSVMCLAAFPTFMLLLKSSPMQEIWEKKPHVISRENEDYFEVIPIQKRLRSVMIYFS